MKRIRIRGWDEFGMEVELEFEVPEDEEVPANEGVEVFGVAIIRYYDPEEGGTVRTYRNVRGYYNLNDGVTDWWYDD